MGDAQMFEMLDPAHDNLVFVVAVPIQPNTAKLISEAASLISFASSVFGLTEQMLTFGCRDQMLAVIGSS